MSTHEQNHETEDEVLNSRFASLSQKTSGSDQDQVNDTYSDRFEVEFERRRSSTTDAPCGMRYVADTRRQSVACPQHSSSKVSKQTRCHVKPRRYLPIEEYGVIGNLRTVAMCCMDGSLDFLCYPKFDSPSVFCRLLDKDKGGHFSITPTHYSSKKQQYLPSSNILVSRFLSEEGVAEVIDYMHIPTQSQRLSTKPLLPWVIRTVRVVRGKVGFKVECYPAFNYARDEHTTKIESPNFTEDALLASKLFPGDEYMPEYTSNRRVVFSSKDITMDLRHVVRCGEYSCPVVNMTIDEYACEMGLKGPGVHGEFELDETQEVVFVFREVPAESKADMSAAAKKMHAAMDPPLTSDLLYSLFSQTSQYWQNWVGHSTYRGRWRENVLRSALSLKLLTYEPTGAVVAAATFGLPESIGGPRNWDYRYVWVRDSSFTIYAFMRLGFTQEASRYMYFIEERCNDLNEDGSLNIMYSIDGAKRLEEVELDHLEGYQESRPVRIGNGAYDHMQLDIYGELMDGIYLYNKYGSPVSYDMWCAVQKLTDYIVKNWHEPDMSIWEVRGQKQHFTYSLVMCWVAIDRALRLAEKRMFPCPKRTEWLTTRDTIYEFVQTKCYNRELQIFTMSVESPEALDASTLIMPLVFFSSPTDPRMMSTISRVLLPPEKGGLMANDLVFRYNFLTTDDGVGGLEGAFSMCTFWLVEALARAGKYDTNNNKLVTRAVVMFEKMLTYSNHLGLFSEEIARSGEMLGNFPQAFTHISFISAAYNLDRVLTSRRM